MDENEVSALESSSEGCEEEQDGVFHISQKKGNNYLYVLQKMEQTSISPK
jgi:hypothetical protein